MSFHLFSVSTVRLDHESQTIFHYAQERGSPRPPNGRAQLATSTTRITFNRPLNRQLGRFFEQGVYLKT
ncbi:hypothetical protein YC2023_071364 [Brassica napus]